MIAAVVIQPTLWPDISHSLAGWKLNLSLLNGAFATLRDQILALNYPFCLPSFRSAYILSDARI
jgi:hypothetical protein